METPKTNLKIDCDNLHHDDDLDRLLTPCNPIVAEFARNVEKQIFSFMLEWKIWKIYTWDDFKSDGDISRLNWCFAPVSVRWDWCFGPVRPENKACREHNFANLVAMDDWHFERLVRSIPKSPNEELVRKWREELRKDPLIIQAAKAEAPPMDWRDLKFDPDLIKKELL